MSTRLDNPFAFLAPPFSSGESDCQGLELPASPALKRVKYSSSYDSDSDSSSRINRDIRHIVKETLEKRAVHGLLEDSYRIFDKWFIPHISQGAVHKQDFLVLKLKAEESSGPFFFRRLETSTLGIPLNTNSLENRITPYIQKNLKPLLLAEAKGTPVKPREPAFIKMLGELVTAKITPHHYLILKEGESVPEEVVQKGNKCGHNFSIMPSLDDSRMLIKHAKGGDLRSFTDNFKKSSTDECADLALQLLQQVQRMHSMGIYHRDIKSVNIVVDYKKDQRKTIQLIDWGFATRETSSTRTCGSQGYMAPELYYKRFPKGNPPTNVEPLKTDLYAVGVTLYEIITGKSFSDSLERIGPPTPDETFHEYFGRKEKAIDNLLDTQETKGALSQEHSWVIKGFLRTDPAKRLSIDEALQNLSLSPETGCALNI
ncbi:MAG: hypothetical protein FJZ61_00455 [Chlamydiae bacterium]|nr:hypothetical protein [Chlamydiota bacterium]